MTVLAAIAGSSEVIAVFSHHARAHRRRENDRRAEPRHDRLAQHRNCKGEGRDPRVYAEHDAIGRFSRRLSETATCPICLEVTESGVNWIEWLDAAAANGEDITDVVPLCRHHVWQALGRSGLSLALPLARTIVAEAQTRLWSARGTLSALRGGWKWLPEPFGHACFRRHARSHTLATLRQVRECPLCRRAHAARDRAIVLLGALLAESEGRNAFERGYGLCVPHAARALVLLGGRPAAHVITAAMHARLCRLRWELEEQLRRYSWSAIPEGHGAEAGAGLRASLLFSGTGCDDGP